MDKKHTLIIGGTGMLECVTLELLGQDNATITVISRGKLPEKLINNRSYEKYVHFNVLTVSRSVLNKIDLDYSDSLQLRNKIQGAIENHGPISLFISWIHSSVNPNAFTVVIEVFLDICSPSPGD